jgi:hypothetical protein
LNPIEKAWFKFKQFLRYAKARTKEALDQTVTDVLKTITPENAATWLATADTGYSNRSFALMSVERPWHRKSVAGNQGIADRRKRVLSLNA